MPDQPTLIDRLAAARDRRDSIANHIVDRLFRGLPAEEPVLAEWREAADAYDELGDELLSDRTDR